MERVAMLNGEFIDINEPVISLEDRGYNFGDGVYEVVPIMDGRLIGFQYHMDRLTRSLKELQIPAVYTHEELYEFHVAIMEKGEIYNGGIYMQITRGVAPRTHYFPDMQIPVVSMIGNKETNLEKVEKKRKEGVRVITTPDIRWGRCDIKSLNILANVLAKQKAHASGAEEAIQYKEDGTVTEGSSSNFMIVKDGIIWTHPDCNDILAGCTKKIIIEDLAPKAGLTILEKSFTLDFAKKADEAFYTHSGGSGAVPVVKIDKDVIGEGVPGEITKKVIDAFIEYVKAQPVQLSK